MTPEQVKRKMTDVLLRAADDGCSEGDAYVLCDMNMPLYHIVRDLLIEQGWLNKPKGHYLTLTAEGQRIVDECRQSA